MPLETHLHNNKLHKYLLLFTTKTNTFNIRHYYNSRNTITYSLYSTIITCRNIKFSNNSDNARIVGSYTPSSRPISCCSLQVLNFNQSFIYIGRYINNKYTYVEIFISSYTCAGEISLLALEP